MPILTKKRHKYTPLPGNKNRNGKSKKTSNNIIELLCNTNFKRITIGTLIFVLLIYYLLRKRITSSSDATLLRAIPKAVHLRTKGTSTFESFEKPTPASTNDKQYNGRDADAFAQEKMKNMMLLHPDVQPDAADDIMQYKRIQMKQGN